VRGGRHSVASFRKSKPQSLNRRLALSKRTNRVGFSLPSYEEGKDYGTIVTGPERKDGRMAGKRDGRQKDCIGL
jgi:hypothetical protein